METVDTPEQFADAFLTTWRRYGHYDRDAVNRLCRMAAAPDSERGARAASALFTHLIEPLNDSFDPRSAQAYDLVMAQVIDFFRRDAGGKKFDEMLTSSGIATEASLLSRRARVREASPNVHPDRLRKVMFLSRVTIGADVALTSVLMKKMRAIAPQAHRPGPGDR